MGPGYRALAQDHSGHTMESMPGMDHADHNMGTSQPDAGDEYIVIADGIQLNRQASGTSWQPDLTPHEGVMSMVGPWMVMTHATLNGVWSDQGGPRGDTMAFVSGMAMVMADRDAGPGRLGLRIMLDPDPLMGKRGYPLLLAAGETANGRDTLTDRQHPHDLFMELSARYSVPLGEKGSIFVYGGLPGEPAYGPPVFMHREAGMDSPEAPLTHHWFDSTHVTFGVVTLGYIRGPWQFEASQFRGREPDQHRFDIETGALDSSSVRLSLNPTQDWSLQVSAARLNSPEALEPDHDEDRVSASALFSRYTDIGRFSATLAWARKDKTPGPSLQAWLLETAVKSDSNWTLFGRAELARHDELSGHHGQLVNVGKLSLGVIHDWTISEHVSFGVGGLISRIKAPDELGYQNPTSSMAFVRLRLR
jgi:hypothetical protein